LNRRHTRTNATTIAQALVALTLFVSSVPFVLDRRMPDF